MEHLVTFALFSGLEANLGACLYSKGVDYTQLSTGRWGHEAPLQTVYHTTLTRESLFFFFKNIQYSNCSSL